MRIRTRIPTLLLPLLLLGCTQARPSMAVVPDRGGHAYNPATPVGAPGVAQPRPRSVAPSAGGRTVTVQPGERLYQIAARENVDLWYLIEINDLVEPVRAGDQIRLGTR